MNPALDAQRQVAALVRAAYHAGMIMGAQAVVAGLGERKIRVIEIQRVVAEHFGIRIADMTSHRRARVVARPRQIAMYLTHELTALSSTQIGHLFGDRDHTTVLSAIRKIKELATADAAFAVRVTELRQRLAGAE